MPPDPVLQVCVYVYVCESIMDCSLTARFMY